MRLFIAACLLLLFTPPLYAQQRYNEFERGLNLSDSQRSQMQEIRKRYSNQWQDLKSESMRRRLELNEMSREPGTDRDRAERLQREMGEMELQRKSLYRSYRDDVNRVLTEEQRERYDRFCNEERQRGPMMRPGMRPGGPRRDGR